MRKAPFQGNVLTASRASVNTLAISPCENACWGAPQTRWKPLDIVSRGFCLRPRHYRSWALFSRPSGEVIDLIGKVAGDLFRVVGGAGVYNDDLVHQIRRSFQAAFQHILLIFYDHTQADACHSGTAFDSSSSAPAGESQREQYFSGPEFTRPLSLSRSHVRRPRSVSHSTGRSHPAG